MHVATFNISKSLTWHPSTAGCRSASTQERFGPETWSCSAWGSTADHESFQQLTNNKKTRLQVTNSLPLLLFETFHGHDLAHRKVHSTSQCPRSERSSTATPPCRRQPLPCTCRSASRSFFPAILIESLPFLAQGRRNGVSEFESLKVLKTYYISLFRTTFFRDSRH